MFTKCLGIVVCVYLSSSLVHKLVMLHLVLNEVFDTHKKLKELYNILKKKVLSDIPKKLRQIFHILKKKVLSDIPKRLRETLDFLKRKWKGQDNCDVEEQAAAKEKEAEERETQKEAAANKESAEKEATATKEAAAAAANEEDKKPADVTLYELYFALVGRLADVLSPPWGEQGGKWWLFWTMLTEAMAHSFQFDLLVFKAFVGGYVVLSLI
ncbi:uncharacterized protein LOC133743844 [Rosa rugosa]|uniref:uncharacterized protein LOC133743844 n=1 Tax=Rosa rugosa TaxID=74645 RepID=UPI002B412231|nr:uncharacterized protein LOC133743844 [Rosa rugosa]XP_062027882.1 uncharacterized protein LOC133743844 [Rosa rugosa]XP_062027883.1 uncharacterized protein LOC133743844 [Rosa rugosa]